MSNGTNDNSFGSGLKAINEDRKPIDYILDNIYKISTDGCTI